MLLFPFSFATVTGMCLQLWDTNKWPRDFQAPPGVPQGTIGITHGVPHPQDCPWTHRRAGPEHSPLTCTTPTPTPIPTPNSPIQAPHPLTACPYPTREYRHLPTRTPRREIPRCRCKCHHRSSPAIWVIQGKWQLNSNLNFVSLCVHNVDFVSIAIPQ